jgi:hypothetical protein
VTNLGIARRGRIARQRAGAVFLSLLVPLLSHAQAVPDFSGTWTLEEAKSDPAPSGRGGRGQSGRGFPGSAAGPVTIRQTASDITIGMTTYKLDGSETTIEGRSGTATARVRWEGTSLVTETSRNVQGVALTTTEVRTLSGAGTEMTVVTTVTTPQGAFTRKMVFSKS